MKIQALREVLVPNLDIYSNMTINLIQVEKACYEIVTNLYSYSTVYLIYFVPYFFMEDQEPILGHYSWRKPFETSQTTEKSKAHCHGLTTWIRVARFWMFFQLLNWGNIFCSLFRGVGWFVACFLRSREFFWFSPLFQFARAGVGAVSKWHAHAYKRALHLWSCFVVFPSIHVCYNLKEAIELKEGQTIYRRTKPVRARSIQISMKHSCFNSYLNGLLSSWTTFLWPATADSFSQWEIACNLLRADERCVF